MRSVSLHSVVYLEAASVGVGRSWESHHFPRLNESRTPPMGQLARWFIFSSVVIFDRVGQQLACLGRSCLARNGSRQEAREGGKEGSGIRRAAKVCKENFRLADIPSIPMGREILGPTHTPPHRRS